MSSSSVQLEELLRCSAVACVFFVLSRCNLLTEAAIHKHTMSKKRHAESTQDENPRKRRQLTADQILVEAVRNGDMTAVRVVLKKFNPDGKTMVFDAAHEACRRNDDESLVLLLPYVETTQMDFGILLSECVHADHVACTEVLLQHWKSVCKNTAFVPHESKGNAGQYGCPAMWSDPAVCRVLIDAGADLHTKNEDQRLPLQYACASGALDVVKMLLPEVDVNYKLDDFSALHLAVCYEAIDVVQLLIDAGADFDTQHNEGYSPLLTACGLGALDIVKILVRAGAGVRVTNDRGETCLQLAVRRGHTETVRYLVCLPEVDVNYGDADNHTALHFAVEGTHTDVVQVLIDAGADIDTKNNYRCSPLHSACISGTLDVVKMLVRAGAGVRATDDEGDTCLILAAFFGHTETVRYLVGLPEVELNHRDTEKNYTALQYAVQENHNDVAQVLMDALYVAIGV